MFDFLSKLFDTSDFPARWHCGHWTAGHGWLHILSDLGVWSAYVAIPCVLGYFVLRRKDIPFRSIFLLFGAFILACGTTHLMEAIIFWWPAYRLAGVIKLFTAVVSWGTVLALVQVTPKVLAMRSAEELEREIKARKEAEQISQQANAKLQTQIEALQKSDERFRLLVDGSKDHAIFMLDPTGRIASWNTGAERINQYRTDEIIGEHFSRLYSADDVQAGKPERELQVAATEGRYEEEGWRLRKDGSRFWSNVVITALRDQNGNLRGFSKITRDMTERKQAEENARRLREEAAARRTAEEHAAAIWEERERLRVTLHSIGDGVIATDAEGRVTLLNPIAEALTGWESAEATGQPLPSVFIIINEQTRQPVENPVSKALREGKIVGLANHTVLVAKDGTERPIDDSAAPIRDQNGRTIGVVMVFRDVTERRRAENALRQTTAHLQIVTDSMVAPVTRCSRDLRYLWVSKACADMLGHTPEEMIGRPILEILGKEAFDQLRPNFEKVLSGETVSYEDVVNYVGVGDRSIKAVYTPTLDTVGIPDGWVAVIIDLTDQKRIEEALKDADRRKDEFLATLAHELRNPLAPIRNVVELLRQAGDDAAVTAEGRTILERQLGHMVRLVDDLMDISRVTSGKLQLRKERVELAAAVQSAVEEKRLVESGCAQCVLGNHDLNILLGDKKEDNHWFFGEPWSLDGSGTPTPAVLADDAIQKTVVDFFRTLPLVLEREDMRVVHACWDDTMVDAVRHATDVEALYRHYDDQISAEHESRPELDKIDRGLERQNRNPVKVLTSGKECRVDTPFRASGKLRHEERVRWWETYDGGPFCVFGHYGTFKDEAPLRGRAICVDFAVGKRWMERISSAFDGKFRAKLGAVRLPEKVLILDDGQIEPIHTNV